MWKELTLTLLLEGEFALLIVVLVLSSSPVLTTLSSRFGLASANKCCGGWNESFSGAHTFPLFFGILNVAQM